MTIWAAGQFRSPDLFMTTENTRSVFSIVGGDSGMSKNEYDIFGQPGELLTKPTKKLLII